MKFVFRCEVSTGVFEKDINYSVLSGSVDNSNPRKAIIKIPCPYCSYEHAYLASEVNPVENVKIC